MEKCVGKKGEMGRGGGRRGGEGEGEEGRGQSVCWERQNEAITEALLLLTYLLGQSNCLLCILQDTIKPRDGVDLCTQGSSLTLQLVSHDVDGIRPRTNEHHTSFIQPLCKLHIF